ncbi:MAG: SLC13 family permease [Acidobacteria bacterium]|nr:SLC13 family permease [Acidobacteriota bacterium]NIM61780.1 SLC13 family permease [Acidobacteriota bacterium]NIO60024.1 SLC13 family permease [Acidobacteriota bacterium]NIQ29216.1 SLC13 family permease [Acidobacteriota bacterium]NIQ83790.1 SLC13 family permease [Acidobacteriota bacterium]
MSSDQVFLLVLLAAVFAMLLWGRIRYDIVAFGALVVAYLGGVVPKDEVFAGFGHPATVIIALVLIVSRGLFRSGVIEVIARHLVDASRRVGLHIAVMSAIAAALSAVMNNVAALALLMPVDLQAAAKAKRSPALTLMPLSFASILGGMVTLIGTPPNVVIATFREQALGAAYTMFDFAPVGLVVALAGVAYVAAIGWRLIPVERRGHDTTAELRDLRGYIAEGTVQEKSKAIDQRLRDLQNIADEDDINLLGLVRNGKRLPGAARDRVIRVGDVVVMEGAPQAIEQFLASAGLEYAGAEKHGGIAGETLDLVEVVAPEGARIVGRSALDVRLLYRNGVTLLGVSRRGRRFRERVRQLRIEAGDILLLLGPAQRLADVIAWLGCLPLADRGIQVLQRSKAWVAVLAFAAAVTLASVDLVYLPVALGAVVAVYVLLRIVPPRQLYDSIEWPVIVLLGCLIPIGGALETSGGTALIAETIVVWCEGLPVVVVLGALMIVTMTLSDVLNNVATALIAAPIGVDVARQLGVSPDPFLMAVAVAASCAFLTPIGHKNNTIIMGPGGYKFGDYWRMGLPLEILVVAVGLPVILRFWPL